jgi:hypothetical protein
VAAGPPDPANIVRAVCDRRAFTAQAAALSRQRTLYHFNIDC